MVFINSIAVYLSFDFVNLNHFCLKYKVLSMSLDSLGEKV